MRVELRDEATEDLVDGAAFYAEQSIGLDEHFLESLRTDLHLLETTAGVHETYRGFYRSLSKRFPSRSTTWLPITLRTLLRYSTAVKIQTTLTLARKNQAVNPSRR